MTREELAAKLNGREYGEEITAEEEREAMAAGLVVVFGCSDDLAEFRGAIHDEMGASDDPIIILDGKLFEDDDCDCRWADAARERAEAEGRELQPHWCYPGQDFSWSYETDIPHATFDVMDGDEKYCRGIVFALSDAGPVLPASVEEGK